MVQICPSPLGLNEYAIRSPLGDQSGPVLFLVCVNMVGNATLPVGTPKMSGAAPST